jgi:STE24 endopeptidase
MAFDPEMATQAWMATLSGAARARSDAYFEGGYWLILWNFLVTVGANLAILHFGWAARLSARARQRAQRPWARSFLFALTYLVLLALITLPFTIYTDFIREHQYSLSNMRFGAWAGDTATMLVISTLVMSLLFIGVHAAIRRAPNGWWLWGTGLTVAGLFVVIAVSPIFIEPLFNTYAPLPAGPVRDAVLSMARANGVPTDNVYLVDASRQTDRISANVAGIFGTTRIALNDNLMKLPADQIRAVMAHELGHHVLNHIWKMMLAMVLIAAFAFLVVARALPSMIARFGTRWRVTSLDDPAILPIAMIALSCVGLVLTPVLNTLVRTQEIEADQFGLNVARAPESFAAIAMKLSQYRKIQPGPVEEAIFFDHPSGHTRVLTAMRWKAEHLGQPDVR